MSDPTADTKKTLIIIPTYNEMENLPLLLEKIESLQLGLHVLIVDDNSPDGTGEWAQKKQAERENLFLIRRPGKRGLGSAYVEGFKYAIKNNYDYVFEMDADFSHNPESIPDFLKAIENADLVVGSRYIKGVTVVNWPIRRLLLSYCANRYARWITGMPIHDATGGYKCFRVNALRRLRLDWIHSDGYSFQIEVTFKLWRKGLRIKEIPILFVDRTRGQSKMSSKIVSEALFLLIRLRLGL